METISVMRTDDTDGSPDAVTRRFSLEGQDYEIDLTEANYTELTLRLAVFVESARKVLPPKPKSRSKSVRAESADIRAWAKAQGITVSENGRLPGRVKDRYWETHPLAA